MAGIFPEYSKTIEQELGELFTIHGCTTVSIEVDQVWNNALQKRTDEIQFQVFSNKNGCCAPAKTLSRAIKNAIARFKECPHDEKGCRYEP